MDSITIEIPGDIVSAMKLPKTWAKDQLLTDVAVSLYQQGILSFGKARELCKLTKWEFSKALGMRKVDRHYDEKDLEEDLNIAVGGQ